MVMNDTCATHRSRVPQRSFGRVKWGVTTVEDERGPGLDFSLCFVCGSRPWGTAAFHLCLFILLLKCRECSPVPASFFPYLSTSLHWCRNPGGRRDMLSESPRCWGWSRCWGDRAAGSSGDHQWLPEAVVLEQWKSRWDGRLAAVLLGRGGVAAIREGAEESAPFASGPEPAAIRQVGGGAGNGGLAAGCPRPEEPPPSARRRMSIGPSTKDVQYHRMAPRVNRSAGWGPSDSVSGNRTDIYFFLSPLSFLCHSSSFRLLFSRLVCPYPQVRRGRPNGLPPGEGGGGGSRAQSRGYPPACEGRWGYVASGAGPRAVGTERGRWSNW